MSIRAGWILAMPWVLAPPLSAQAVLAGVVREDGSGRVLEGVEVLIEKTSLRTVTGASGRYVLPAVPIGRRTLLFRQVGFLPMRVIVNLAARDTTQVDGTLVPRTVVLDSILVEARRNRGGVGVEGFEDRRRLGMGRFFDSLELRRAEHVRLNDLLRRKGGVAVGLSNLDGRRQWVALNPEMRDFTGVLNCAMQVYYNGIRVGLGGKLPNATPPDLQSFDVASLGAVEVYRSGSEVPVEYGGPHAACGAVLLWSRQR